MTPDRDVEPAGGDAKYLDRPEFLKRVGIDQRTLTRWVAEGVLVPRPAWRNGRSRQTFPRSDVAFARGLASILKQRRGELRLHEAVAIVHGEIAQPDTGHNPAGPPLTK